MCNVCMLRARGMSCIDRSFVCPMNAHMNMFASNWSTRQLYFSFYNESDRGFEQFCMQFCACVWLQNRVMCPHVCMCVCIAFMLCFKWICMQLFFCLKNEETFTTRTSLAFVIIKILIYGSQSACIEFSACLRTSEKGEYRLRKRVCV